MAVPHCWHGDFARRAEVEAKCLRTEVEPVLDVHVERFTEIESEHLDTLYRQAFESAKNGAEMEDAVASWSSCMSSRGYNYNHPLDALEAPWKLEPDAVERDTAVADVECKQEVALMEKWEAEYSDAKRSLIEEYRPVLEKMKKNDMARLEAALDVIAGSR